MTAYQAQYRLVVFAPRSTDPSEVTPLQPVAGAPHGDYLKVTTGPAIVGPTKITSGMLSHSGLTAFNATQVVDGVLGADSAWHTDSAVPGAWLKVDLGAGTARRFQMARIWVSAGGTYAGVYDVEYSDNDAVWTKAFVGMKPTTGGAWHAVGWLDLGAHRYWRILLTNTPGAGPWLSELELWEAGGPGDWKPYLLPPTGRRGRVDFLQKNTDVGVMTFRVANPALAPSDPLTRWLTSYAGNLKGKLQLGNLRVAVWESLDNGVTLTPFWSGRLRTCEDAGGPAAYDLGVRELSDDMEALAFVGTPAASVTEAGFPSLLPIGTTAAYGTLPVVTPLTGTISGRVVGVRAVVSFDAASAVRADNIITKNLLESISQPMVFHQFETGITAAAPTFTGPARVKLKRLDTQATGTFLLGSVGPGRVFAFGGTRHVRSPGLIIAELPTTALGYMALPPDTTSVEVTVYADQLASDDTPLLIDGLNGPKLWRYLLEGKFGYPWSYPEQLPPGKSYGDPRIPIPFDAAKFAALEADERFPVMRFRITKREPRGKFIEREILRPCNLAYYRNGAGVVVPVDLRLPSDVSAVPTITDADLVTKEPPGWKYDRGRAITRMDGARYTDVLQSVDDIASSTDLYPRIAKGGFDELRHPISILDLGSVDLGDEPFKIDAKGFRAMPGELIEEQSRGIYLERRLVDLVTEMARPYSVGGVSIPLVCKRGGNGDTQPGELRKLAVRAIPDPGTNKHGGTRLVRVAERTESQGAIILNVEDLGLSTAAGTPTLGAPAQETGNTTAGATTAVTLASGDYPVEVHYAVTPTSIGIAPVEADRAWTPYEGGPVRTSVTVTVRQLPAGKRIWFRGRSFPDARVDYKLPSAWVAAGGTGRVDLATLAAPSAPAGSLQTGKSFRVSWTNGDATLGVEVLLAQPTTDPRVVIARMPPGSTFVDIPGDISGLVLTVSTTYRVGLRHYLGDAALSSEVTVDVTTTGSAGAAPATGGFALLVGKP